VQDEDKEGVEALKVAFPRMVMAITDCLGFEPTGSLWAIPGVKWDLPTGSRINLPESSDGLFVHMWSPRLAIIERSEIAHGVDPAHVLDDVDY